MRQDAEREAQLAITRAWAAKYGARLIVIVTAPHDAREIRFGRALVPCMRRKDSSGRAKWSTS